MTRRTRLTIDLSAILANYQLACQRTATSNTMAVIKANAYGHGVVRVASALQSAPAFAVATIDEALHLRQHSDKPILILQGCMRLDELVEVKRQHLTPMIHQQQQVALLTENPTLVPPNLWLKIDTGMARLGFKGTSVNAVIYSLKALPNSPQLVICSHMANASSPAETSNQKQLDGIMSLRKQHPDLQFSLANSAAILSDKRYHLDWNRAGIMLYGGSPFDDMNHPDSMRLKPAMRLTSEVIALRDLAIGESVGYGSTWTADRPSRIATVAIGYADGYPRHAKIGSPVFIKEKLLPLVGRVSMDMITIDVTDHSAVSIGDEVELFGHNLSINRLAEDAGTISYEIMTSITERVERIYQ